MTKRPGKPAPAASDEEDRRRIQTDLETNFVVEASAGTGKTSSLAARIVALVGSGAAETSEIAAVTFTKKAAAELRTRVAARLESRIRTVAAGAEKRRLCAARDRLDLAFIGTIHAFCSRLIRERPVEAGIDPEFREADEDAGALLREEAWRAGLDALRMDRRASAELDAMGVETHRLREAFEEIAEYPDVSIVPSAAPLPDFAGAVRATSDFLDALIPALVAFGKSRAPDALAAAAWEAHYFRENRPLDDPAEAAAFLAFFREKKATQKNWPRPDLAKRFSDDAKTLQRDWIDPTLEAWWAFRYPVVVRFLTSTAEDFRRRRIDSGQPGFTDLLLLARDMLRDHGAVRDHFRRRYRRVLVDEFQDTDPVQAEAMLYLTANASADSWHRLVPSPGALFVVGDPKQSIYRFRRADIDVYLEVRAAIERSGGEVLRLSRSFRTAPALAGWINGVFSEHFQPGVPHQAEDVPLDPGRPDPAGRIPAGAFALVSEVAGRKTAPVWRADADAVARWISTAIAEGAAITVPEGGRENHRPVRASDFLVILRNATRLDAYARALESADVPAVVAGGKAFKDSEEVRALIPILRAAADPDDPVPVVAFLRGAFCGADDEALREFRASGGRFHLGVEPAPGTDPRIVAGFEMLRRAREISRRLPPGAAVERIVDRLGIVPAAYAGEAGERRAGNLAKARTMARGFSEQKASFSEVVEGLSALIADGEAPEMAIEPVREDAVRVTNLHKTKGLEAPIVFLAGPVSDSGREGATVWIDRRREPPVGHFLIRDDSNLEVARPLEWTEALRIEEEHEDAEKSRLLYVAATRAMNTLIVSGYVDVTTKSRKVVCGPWKDLVGDALPDAPDWTGRRVPQAAPAEFRPDGAATAESLIAAAWQEIAVPSQASASPSKFETPAEFGRREATGRGLSWGRVLHRLLEAAMRKGAGEADLEPLTAALLRAEERPAEELAEVRRVLGGILSSDLWRRAKASPERFVEVPFAAVVRSRDYGLPAPPDETLVNGAIDLVFREEGSWKLIDYKSDALTLPVEDLCRTYAPQLRAYRDQWERLTGDPTEAGLYFLEEPSRVHWL